MALSKLDFMDKRIARIVVVGFVLKMPNNAHTV